jgi:hypothetical protein
MNSLEAPDSSNISDKIVLDNRLTREERQSFSKYLREVVLADEKVDIIELTRWKLRGFVNSEWWEFNKKLLLWKWWVKNVQRLLGMKGEEIDWYFWPYTLKKTIEFQKNNWLEPDGIVWDLTLNKLKRVRGKNKVGDDNEKLDNNQILAVFNSTPEWKLFLKYIMRYSTVSVEKLVSLIYKSSQAFDISANRIVAVIIWETDLRIIREYKRNPFEVNKKWVWQFVWKTFKELYSRVRWKIIRWWKNKAIRWNVLQYFEYRWKKKYAENLKNIWISKSTDRYDPEKSIMAIWAYLRYIMLAWKWIHWDESKAVARYNVWPNWKIADHMGTNPAINATFISIYWDKARKTEARVVLAAQQYYNKFAGNSI